MKKNKFALLLSKKKKKKNLNERAMRKQANSTPTAVYTIEQKINGWLLQNIDHSNIISCVLIEENQARTAQVLKDPVRLEYVTGNTSEASTMALTGVSEAVHKKLLTENLGRVEREKQIKRFRVFA